MKAWPNPRGYNAERFFVGGAFLAPVVTGLGR